MQSNKQNKKTAQAHKLTTVQIVEVFIIRFNTPSRQQ